MHPAIRMLLFAVLPALLAGCGGPDRTLFTGTVHPPTDQVAKAFVPAQVERSCRVFAEVLVHLPADLTGQEIENILLAEAGQRGADLMLIGQSRQGTVNATRFLYYGPEREYPFAERWRGWKFGYEVWEKQGDWVSIGYNELGRAEVRYDVPLIMQVAMLRCR